MSLVDAKKIRANVKGQLTRVRRFLLEFDPTMEGAVHLLESRLTAFTPLLDKFDAVQTEFEMSLSDNESDLAEQEEERTKFENEFFMLQAKFTYLISKCKMGNALNTSGSTQSATINISNTLKLPKIELPMFEGELTEWRSFSDIFDSMVHNNTSLGDVDKFLYLKSALKGEALKIVGSLSTTAVHYEQARQLLRDRYENYRCIKQAHLKLLFDQPEVKPRCVASLRHLLDTTNKHVAALNALGEQTEMWSSILNFLVLSKLDFESKKQFELHYNNLREPTFAQLLGFFNNRCQALERVETNNKSKNVKSFTSIAENSSKTDKNSASTSNSRFNKSSKCPICKREHTIYHCNIFAGLSAKERFDKSKELRLCINCLSKDHSVGECKSRSCYKCDKKHHTLLHFEGRSSASVNTESSSETPDQSSTQTNVSLQSSYLDSEQVLLSTSLLKVKNLSGDLVTGRALLDTGSQCCFISEGFSRRLKLKSRPTVLNVNTLGYSTQQVTSFIDLEIHSNTEKFSLPIRAFVLPKLTAVLPQTPVEQCSELEFLNALKLADPSYGSPGNIDILLSNESFLKIIQPGIRSNKTGNIKALNTTFGWIVGGTIKKDLNRFTALISFNACEELPELDFKLTKFWEYEEIMDVVKKELNPCEEHFKLTCERDCAGRFHVELPFIQNDLHYNFSSSKRFALSRFNALERKFFNEPEFKKLYTEFIEDYLRKGFVEKVPLEDYEQSNAYYLPHHGVLKESSMTTKLRTVFDGSSALSGYPSLNSTLFSGPKTQNDMFNILLRFRIHYVCFLSDIEKMYCQIKIKKHHRDFLRFFWRTNDTNALTILRLTSLPFGLNCSPYIAITCLKKLARELKKSFPEACNTILHDSYIDDIISGSDTLGNAMCLTKDLQTVCISGGFNLRKWYSNNDSLLKFLSQSINLKADSFDIVEKPTKVLGIPWCPKTDEFFFDFDSQYEINRTKRSILSSIVQIFDPFGWLGPIIIKGKILIQQLWLKKVDWDLQLPYSLGQEWLTVLKQLSSINEVRITRYLGDLNVGLLCAFTDASEKAYGSCIYLVGNGTVKLLAAKSRVAPLKTISLARLELCAAVLGAKLLKILMDNYRIPAKRCFLFTDSTIVLAWLAKPSNCWKTFIANRVSEIHSLIPECSWLHVKSSENSADILSRGILPVDLVKFDLWWKGPSWLSTFTGIKSERINYETENERRKQQFELVSFSAIVNELCENISNYTKLIRVFAWVYRYINNLRLNPSSRKYGLLTVEEIELSTKKLIRTVQAKHFSSTIEALTINNPLKPKDSLLSLTPFLDQNNLLRVGGRLHNAYIPYDTKHPIILPKKDRFVDLLISFEHRNNFHIGANGLVAALRKKYWVVNAKTVCKRIIGKCLVCFKFRPIRSSQLMGSLPKERSEIVRAFYNVGVDFCGPFRIRPNSGRGNTTRKCYLALFICFSTKAIHVETVSDLSTDAFLGCLRRFISRRGMPVTIFSDNGTNFVGASNKLNEWYLLMSSPEFQQKIYTELLKDQITWKFIPAKSPNFGGLWESHIKSLKTCLIKTMGRETLTYEEFSTLVVQVEATLNTRPLWVVTNAEDDLDILTPGHFLIGANLKALPDTTYEEFQGHLGARWRHVQQIFRHYWQRWSREVLLAFNDKQKFLKIRENIKVDDIGLLVDEQTPPFIWPLCKVLEVIKGPDNLVRVLKLKTATNVYLRAVTKFAKLPHFSGTLK